MSLAIPIHRTGADDGRPLRLGSCLIREHTTSAEVLRRIPAVRPARGALLRPRRQCRRLPRGARRRRIDVRHGDARADRGGARADRALNASRCARHPCGRVASGDLRARRQCLARCVGTKRSRTALASSAGGSRPWSSRKLLNASRSKSSPNASSVSARSSRMRA